MTKNKYLIGISLVIFALVLSACGSKNENNSNKTSNENNKNTNEIVNKDENPDGEVVDVNVTGKDDYETDLAEADEVARRVLEAFMTIDYHALYDMGSASLKKQLEDEDDDQYFVLKYFDPENSPLLKHGVSLHGDYYGIERYDSLYDEEHEIYWYGIRVLSLTASNHLEKLTEPDFVITNDLETLKDASLNDFYFGVKKSGDEWVASEVRIFLDSHVLISESEADMAKENPYIIHKIVPKSKLEEVYGDDSDIGF